MLYAAFLGNVYEESFRSAPEAAGATVSDTLIGGCVGSRESWHVALGYYIANLLSTLMVCLGAAAICLLYLSQIGWYLTGMDVALLLLDILLLTLFGSALSSIINFFLSSQGQISAVGTIVSAGYGFICGAYMPISNFSEGLQKVISILSCGR